jgi:hypothetical protein
MNSILSKASVSKAVIISLGILLEIRSDFVKTYVETAFFATTVYGNGSPFKTSCSMPNHSGALNVPI